MSRFSLPLSLAMVLWAGSAFAAPTNDHFSGAAVLSGWTASSTVDPAGSQLNSTDPNRGAYQPYSLWWAYTPPADGEVSISVTPVMVSSNDFLVRPTNGQGYEVYLYNQVPAATSPGHANFFDDHWGGRRAAENALRLSSLDMRFAGKANTTYYIEIGNYANSGPITIKAATAIGTSSWYWRSDAKGYTGYAIEMRGGNVFAGFFLYNSDGSANWLTAIGPLSNGNHFVGQLQQYAGGQPFTNAQTPSQVGRVTGSAGTVTIDWTGPCAATMTWPGGSVPIQCYVFDTGGGWANSGKPNGYHDTGWYLLPEDGGGRGLFGQAQGTSEFWVMFHYDATGKATWHVSTLSGLPSNATQPAFGGAPNQYQSTCAAWANATNPATSQPYIWGYKWIGYTGGQTLTGPWQPATQNAAPLGYSGVNCDAANFNTVSVAGYSTLNGPQFSGPSTTLGGTDLSLDRITDSDVITDPATGQTIQQASPAVPAYQQVCADMGGECHFARYQF